MAGCVLVGWIRPNLRAGLGRAVTEIGTEARRGALQSLRERVEGKDPPPADVPRLIDEAIKVDPAH